MDTRSVSQSDINRIEAHVDRLERSVYGARDTLGQAAKELDNVERSVHIFRNEFDEYMEFDKAQKELALAKIRIVGTRQKLEAQFGHYEQVRQQIVGILQALDSGLVNQETIRGCQEQLMVACPRYWLAPCLIALAAWISDDQELAHRALQEALARDDEKTSLLFALISRRARRSNAVGVWLERYFGMQDPTHMERKMVIVLDAFSNGLFGSDVREMCAEKIGAWIEELSEAPGFVEEQVERWRQAFESKHLTYSHHNYKNLPNCAENWKQIMVSLDCAAMHVEHHRYFEEIFSSRLNMQVKLNEELDRLLDTYVSNFDAEELPLRREEHMLRLIIEEEGNVTKAERRFEAEKKALDDVIDFAQLLTNAAMYPEESNASKATQKLAVALSKDWVVQSYEDLAASHRAAIPSEVPLKVDTWQGRTRDGGDAEILMREARQHFELRRDRELESVRLRAMDYFWPIAGAIALIIGLASPGGAIWGILFGIGGAAGILYGRNRVKKEREALIEKYNVLMRNTDQTIDACCTEVAAYRREHKAHEEAYEPFISYLQNISPEQYIQSDEQERMLA